jgi:hypothetical protein
VSHSALGYGGVHFPPLGLAETAFSHWRWRKVCQATSPTGGKRSHVIPPLPLAAGRCPPLPLAERGRRHAYMQMLFFYRMLWLHKQSELRMYFFCRPQLSVLTPKKRTRCRLVVLGNQHFTKNACASCLLQHPARPRGGINYFPPLTMVV